MSTKPVTVRLGKDSLITEDLIIARSADDDAVEVFIYPANLGAPLIDEHPSKTMVVVSLPTSDFRASSSELIRFGKARLAGPIPPRRSVSGVAPHELDLEPHDAAGNE